MQTLRDSGGLMELLSMIKPEELGTLMSILGNRSAKQKLPSVDMYSQAVRPLDRRPDAYKTPGALGKGAYYPSRRV